MIQQDFELRMSGVLYMIARNEPSRSLVRRRKGATTRAVSRGLDGSDGSVTEELAHLVMLLPVVIRHGLAVLHLLLQQRVNDNLFPNRMPRELPHEHVGVSLLLVVRRRVEGFIPVFFDLAVVVLNHVGEC